MNPMAKKLVIVGAGGFGREVLDVVEAMNLAAGSFPIWDFLGFIDDIDQETYGRGLVLSGVDGSDAFEAEYVIAIGDPARRELVAHRMVGEVAVLVHPSATFGDSVKLGPGAIVCAGVRVTTNVTIGSHVHLNLNSTVGHDTVIGDHVTLYPGVNLSGSVQVGQRVSFGTNSSVLQGLVIGDDAVIAAGAVVVGDVPAGVTAKGVPARW